MPTKPYEEILQRAQAELTAEEQNQLAAELSRLAAHTGEGLRNITELRGLGKEIWKGIDPDQYVAEERDSWDG